MLRISGSKKLRNDLHIGGLYESVSLNRISPYITRLPLNDTEAKKRKTNKSAFTHRLIFDGPRSRLPNRIVCLTSSVNLISDLGGM